MIIKQPTENEKSQYDKLVPHPIQSWEWGEFRWKTGIKVIRRGIYQGRNLVSGFQLTIHPLPFSGLTIGYLPKGPLPNKSIIDELVKIGKAENCIFIKIEPNSKKFPISNFQFPISNTKLVKSPHPLFTPYTFEIDLTKSEEELMAKMKEKTRYNIRLAQRHGVKVVEDNSNQAFETYLKLYWETCRRQKFYAHDEKYHQLMWQALKPSGIAHLLIAYYSPPKTNNSLPLAAWILFLFNDVLYYPYGASSSEYRNLMASNLMMWEAIRFGKTHGAKTFDLWGSLGPTPNPKDPWYGFHRFKEGYSGKLVELIGSYDLILKPLIYPLYNLAQDLRWLVLKLKAQRWT